MKLKDQLPNRLLNLTGKRINEDFATDWESNWKVPIPIINITKNQIRQVVTDVFGRPCFGTLVSGNTKIQGNNVTLKIQIANMTPDEIDASKGTKLATALTKLGIKSNGIPLKFKRFSIHRYRDDISSYEPSKISPGTMEDFEDVYIILSTK